MGRNRDATGRVALEQALILDEPAGETAQDGLGTGTMANTDTLLLQIGEVGLDRRPGERGRLERGGTARARAQPGKKLAETRV